MSGDAISFRVLKGSKFLFNCALLRGEEALPPELQQYVVRTDELAFLSGMDVAITKRVSLEQVDQMIACCRQHPPQALLTPASGDHVSAFEELALYLKERGRAGVCALDTGGLVLLIPLADRADLMRCQLINTNTTVAEIGAQISIRVDTLPSDTTEATAAKKPSPTTKPGERETPSITASSEPSVDPSSTKPPLELKTDQHDNNDKHAKFRTEHAAFHAFYHHVLLEWSTKPSDAGTELEELRQSS